MIEKFLRLWARYRKEWHGNDIFMSVVQMFNFYPDPFQATHKKLDEVSVCFGKTKKLKSLKSKMQEIIGHIYSIGLFSIGLITWLATTENVKAFLHLHVNNIQRSSDMFHDVAFILFPTFEWGCHKLQLAALVLFCP